MPVDMSILCMMTDSRGTGCRLIGSICYHSPTLFIFMHYDFGVVVPFTKSNVREEVTERQCGTLFYSQVGLGNMRRMQSARTRTPQVVTTGERTIRVSLFKCNGKFDRGPLSRISSITFTDASRRIRSKAPQPLPHKSFLFFRARVASCARSCALASAPLTLPVGVSQIVSCVSELKNSRARLPYPPMQSRVDVTLRAVT